MLYERLKSPETPDRLQQSITLDFIIKLLTSKEKYTYIICNLIYIVIDRLIKEAYIIAQKKSNTTEDLIYMFLKEIIIVYKVLKEIISNRNKLFTLKF